MVKRPCIPGLRQQRDEALRERDAARRELVANECGWSYLYPEEELSGR